MGYAQRLVLVLEGCSDNKGKGNHISKGPEVWGACELLGDDGCSSPREEGGGGRGLGWEGPRLPYRSRGGAWQAHSFFPSLTYSALIQLAATISGGRGQRSLGWVGRGAINLDKSIPGLLFPLRVALNLRDLVAEQGSLKPKPC